MVALKTIVKSGEGDDEAEIEGGIGHHHSTNRDDEQAGGIDEAANDGG